MDKEGQQKKDYIGCVMSLISKQEIRYVGTLVMINSKEQTLILKSVRSYGSEGRRGNGPDEVPASSQVYEHIIFKAAELKDFYVIKDVEKEFKDPAIVSTEEKKEAAPAPVAATGEKKPAVPQDGYPHEGEPRGDEPYRHPRGATYPPRYYRSGPRFVQGEYAEHPVTDVKEKYKADFDFEAMNSKFQNLFTEKDKTAAVEPGYNKTKSFYDSLSATAKEERGGDTAYDPSKQREINAATFDLGQGQQEFGRGRYYGRRGYRRGGYGGRSRYRRGGDYYGGYHRGGDDEGQYRRKD